MTDFFKNTDLTRAEAENIIDETLLNKDDGELYLQNSINENIILDDGKIKNTNFTKTYGMGFRGVSEDVTAYCHSNSINKNSLIDASKSINSTLKSSKSYKHNNSIRRTNESLYSDHNPIEARSLKEKIELLNTVDQYLRSKSNLIKQVTASISTEKKI